jgi:hypothetical protein
LHHLDGRLVVREAAAEGFEGAAGDDRRGRATPETVEMGRIDDASVGLARTAVASNALDAEEHVDAVVADDDIDLGAH